MSSEVSVHISHLLSVLLLLFSLGMRASEVEEDEDAWYVEDTYML